MLSTVNHFTHTLINTILNTMSVMLIMMHLYILYNIIAYIMASFLWVLMTQHHTVKHLIMIDF